MKAEGILPTIGSKFDPLTGLYNRDTFFMEAKLLLGARYNTKYSIICMDISCFKIINDLFHVDTGNLILRTAAEYLKTKLNPRTSISCRADADHFILCVPNDELDIDCIIRELDERIQALHISHNILFFAGIYPVDNVNLPIDQMCDRAGMALRRIKGSYLTRYAYYDAKMREQMIEEQLITGNMEAALLENQFTIYLQPIYDPHKDTVASAEALVRWFHPVHGMVSPGKFIPVCERNGFIVRLDRFVWEEACRLQRKRLNENKPIVPISVNLSRLNFYSSDLTEFLSLLLEKYDLEPWMLKLEVTESAYTDNQAQLLDMISTFKSLGFPVLMDDFGSGYSSLNMLKDMPLDTIKVDMAFIRELEKSPRVAIILKFIVELTNALGMGTVIEGVETQTQADYVASLGDVAIQGYYFSRPLPIKDYEKLLDKYLLPKEGD